LQPAHNLDAIVVGAGHNWPNLCGAYLGMAGSRVCVFERCSVAGGACLTEEFHRGFRFSITTYSVSLLQPFISARKIPFPGDGDWWLAETRGSNLELMGGEAKHLVLLGPCGGQVGEAGNAHAMRKSTVNRRFDEIGRERRTDGGVTRQGPLFARALNNTRRTKLQATLRALIK
jgi:hypothetical protein